MNQPIQPQAATDDAAPSVGDIDLAERGKDPDGSVIKLNRRLFMQFMAFRNGNGQQVANRFRDANVQAVLYQDVNDPRGYGVLVYCLDPAYLIDVIQPILQEASINHEAGQLQEEFTMLGRTYSIGYESDLEDVLVHRPCRRVCDPATPWAVYYPVRRSGAFERQPIGEQRKMLMEHGGIGHAFGKAGLATDIRLAGHGLNKDDNDFIIGLLGGELFPLSALVQKMRRTRQTSEFIDHMGPFFVGRAVWQPEYDPAKLA
ncbi:MAG: chlorite dismutase family protein [Planctomycetota bacterium]